MASDSGKRLLQLMQQTERTCRQVAQLLETAEDIICEEDGWKNAAMDTSAWGDAAYSINSPNRWMPADAFRLLKFKDVPALVFVSVILRNFERSYERFEEPLITAGFLAYAKLPKVDGSIYKLTRCHPYQKARVDDGTWHRTHINQVHEKERKVFGATFQELKSFGLPLVEISDAEAVRQRVVEPLLAGFRGHFPELSNAA